MGIEEQRHEEALATLKFAGEEYERVRKERDEARLRVKEVEKFLRTLAHKKILRDTGPLQNKLYKLLGLK